ncbi:MAG: PDZ domain-containing protein [Oscillospiraceae bacterium]|jgi:carboxyl-terminal processing protease|nr:PDZ domain-containing protein [Oscillospiraceae bacterium]
MNRKVSLGVALAMAILCVAVSIPLTMVYARREQNRIISNLPQRAEHYDAVEEIDRGVQENYLRRTSGAAINEALVRGYVAGLHDPYCYYMDAKEYLAYTRRLEGSAPDLGLVISDDPALSLTKDGVIVSQVQPGSPAAASGLLKGDIITKVMAESRVILSAEDLTPEKAAPALARLAELNDVDAGVSVTHIAVTYKRRDVTKTVNVMVGHNLPTVTGELKGTVGVLKITAFYRTTRDQLEQQAKDLISKGATSLVFDLRGCREGTLEYACTTLDYLVPAGKSGAMATITYRDGKQKSYPSDAASLTMPAMAVLIDSETSGPAELFAYDMRAYGKATLIGAKTEGNGSLQLPVTLETVGGAVMLTVGEIVPYGASQSFDSIGVTPDIITEGIQSSTQDVALGAALAKFS